MDREEKEKLVRRLVNIVPEERLKALLDPTDGILWAPGEEAVKREASRLREKLQIGAMDSQSDFAEAYQTLLILAAAHGPNNKDARETIKLMIDILKEARSSTIDYQKTEFIERLRDVWEIVTKTIFEPMTKIERQKVFTQIQAELKTKNLPYKLLEFAKKRSKP